MHVGVWEYEPGEDALRASAIIAMDQLAPPEFSVEAVSSRGDHLIFEVVSPALLDL